MNHRCYSLLFAIVLLATGPIRPREQGDSYTWLAFEELRRDDLSRGDRVEVFGKYIELRDSEIILFESTARFLVKDPNLMREILSLSAAHETLILRAVCLDAKGPEPLLHVQASSPGPDLAEAFRKEIRKLREGGRESAEMLVALARRIRRTAERFERPDLRELSREAGAAAIEKVETDLEPTDVSGRLDNIHRLHEVLEDREFAMQLLADLERRFPASVAVREHLIRLKCRRFRGRWMTYEQFKTLQGYDEHGGRWVKRHEKEFLILVENFLQMKNDPIVRRMLKREYQIFSARGDVAIGMNREEVHNALGFPDRVYRKIVFKFDAHRELDQWIYGEKYYYFLDGLLIQHPGEKL